MRRCIVAAAAAAVFVTAAEACTGVYVGRKVSVEGNVLIGRTIDSGKAVVGKAINLLDRVEDAPGRYYSGGNDRGGWPLPPTTWKCLMTPQVNMRHAFRYDSACLNEKGLALSGTVTGATNDEALKADPFVKEGFGESSVVGLLALSCSTAREVVELLGKVVAERGHDMPEIYMAADKDEAWYIEVYTGHQWAAVKMPEDKVLVIGNQFMIGEFDPASTNVMCSPDVVNLPLRAGFAKKGKKGLVNLALSYGKPRSPYSNMRTWYGHTVFAPQDKIGDYVNDREYPLFYTPSRKLSKRDIFELMRSRYEGTKYCPEESGDYGVRVIGTVKQCSCHVLEVDAGLPEEKRAMMWATFAQAEHSPFIPISCDVSGVEGPYSLFSTDMTLPYNGAIAAHSFRRLAILAEMDRRMTGKGVRDYWSALEDRWMTEFPLVVAGGDKEDITAYLRSIQRRALEDARAMFDEISWYNTFHSLKPGDSPTKPLPEKKPYVYSRASERHEPGFKLLLIAGAPFTNSNSGVVYKGLVNAAQVAGYTPLVIPYMEDARRIDAVLDKADAIMIGGSNAQDDYDKRKKFDTQIIRGAAARGIPVLGFCHGHQMINLAFGGSIGRIATNLTPKVVHKGTVRPYSRNNFHDINIVSNTWLHGIVGADTLRVNSSHVYEVRNVGKGLKVSARGADGVVEAIEHETLPVTGFQFHPETIGDMGEIYDRLIREALSRKKKELAAPAAKKN